MLDPDFASGGHSAVCMNGTFSNGFIQNNKSCSLCRQQGKRAPAPCSKLHKLQPNCRREVGARDKLDGGGRHSHSRSFPVVMAVGNGIWPLYLCTWQALCWIVITSLLDP
jgi:hypothetical protein